MEEKQVKMVSVFTVDKPGRRCLNHVIKVNITNGKALISCTLDIMR